MCKDSGEFSLTMSMSRMKNIGHIQPYAHSLERYFINIHMNEMELNFTYCHEIDTLGLSIMTTRKK